MSAPKRNPSKLPTGVHVRHSRSCSLSSGGDECSCEPSYRAVVYDKRTGTHVRSEAFSGKGAVAAAKLWRADQLSALGKGRNIVPSSKTLRQLAEEWLAGAEAEPPTILTRSGQPYKPSVLRCYRNDLMNLVLPELGALKVSAVRRRDLQDLIDRLVGEGRSGSKVRNALMPARVLFRHALERDEVQVNPSAGLRLPNGLGRRERAASADEAGELLDVLGEDVRPLYATAFYAGLRRGELRALRWEDVNLASGTIRVHRSWDDYAGEVAPKSAKGERVVRILPVLRDYLMAQRLRTGGEDRHFVFPGRHNGDPHTPTNMRRKAAKAWAIENERRTEEAAQRGERPKLLSPIGLHECRHTFVSYCAAAGIALERIGDYVGHSSTYMTDRYRHLLEGQAESDARMLDDYLARADTRSRVAQLDDAGEEA